MVSLSSAMGWAKASDASAFTINVHVTKSRLEMDPGAKYIDMAQWLDATVGGHHLVLKGQTVKNANRFEDGKPWVLPPGDYKARVKKEDTAPSGAYWRTYELRLRDGSTWDCDVIGESE